MTGHELERRKSRLEDDIYYLLQEFKSETELCINVMGIDVSVDMLECQALGEREPSRLINRVEVTIKI